MDKKQYYVVFKRCRWVYTVCTYVDKKSLKGVSEINKIGIMELIKAVIQRNGKYGTYKAYMKTSLKSEGQLFKE